MPDQLMGRGIVQPPLVSIYIPTRGRPKLLERAVQSVLAQTWRSIELIVVVDGACAATESFLASIDARQLAGMQLRVEVFSETRGACAARNEALRLARGVYVTGLDDDDYFLPRRIETLVNAFDPVTCSFLSTGYLRVKQANVSSAQPEQVRPPWRKVTLKRLMRSNVVGNQVFTTTERMCGIGGFDEALPAWQDYDCWLRLLLHYGPAVTIDTCSYVQDTASDHLQRISSDMARVSRAVDLFIGKHEGSGGWAFPSFVRMNHAFYGGDVLRFVDLLMILIVDPRWFLPAAKHYLGGKLNRK